MSESRLSKAQVLNSVTGLLQQPYQQVTVSYRPFDGGEIAAGPEQAETWYRRGRALKEQMRFQEALTAFEAAIALKPDHAEAHNGSGIALANLDRPAEAIEGFDRAIALRPDYAEAYSNRGLVLQDLKRLDEARASFDKALALQPDNAGIHNNRGTTLHEAKRLDEALASYDRAVALKADYAVAHYNRGSVLQDLLRFDAALAAYDAAIALNGNYAAAYHNRGVVLQALGRLDEALSSFEKTIALTGGFPEVFVNQSHCLLLMGRYADGWRLHEWRKQTVAPVGNRSFPQPLWLGNEDVANKTLLVHCEQGLGDTIQFCRYGKLLKARGANVVMAVQPALRRLLNQLSPGISVINENETPAAFDYHCPMMSLPLALGTTLHNIPSERSYLSADQGLARAWDSRLPPRTKPRIGIVWRGNPAHGNDRNRSIELAALAPLFSFDAQWMSLQKELGGGDRASLGELRHIVQLGDELSDFSDTAALIDCLDLVITVDTAVAHLAGAMGKPVWILLPYNSDWRWLLNREGSPWYPTARLFRQDKFGSWDSAIDRVGAALRDEVRSGSGS